MRHAELRELVAEQVTDVHDLVDLLELTIEDILNKFPSKLTEHREKFGVLPDEEEAERWQVD